MSLSRRIAIATRGLRGGLDVKNYVDYTAGIEDASGLTADIDLESTVAVVEAISLTPSRPINLNSADIAINITQGDRPINVSVTDAPVRVTVNIC